MEIQLEFGFDEIGEEEYDEMEEELLIRRDEIRKNEEGKIRGRD
ncbi:MAG: hypothetical protein ABIH89_06360 [Elusimicrobiota bacterium]